VVAVENYEEAIVLRDSIKELRKILLRKKDFEKMIKLGTDFSGK
jgi:protein-arginine kinase activator protein McsA